MAFVYQFSGGSFFLSGIPVLIIPVLIIPVLI
jgi:hypothetical protein